MRKFLILFLSFILCACPLTVHASEVFEGEVIEEEDYGIMLLADIPLKWSDAYQCIFPDEDGFTYCCIATSSYGSGMTFILWSDDPFEVSYSSTTSGKQTLAKNTMYYKSFGANAVSSAFDWLFNKENTNGSIASFNGLSSTQQNKWTNESKITIHYSNANYTRTDIATGTSYTQPANWPVAVADSEYLAFSNFLKGTWEKLYSVKFTLFGVDISAISLIVGPFFIAIGIGFLNKIFDLSLSTGAFGVRIANNHISKKRAAAEAKNRNSYESYAADRARKESYAARYEKEHK